MIMYPAEPAYTEYGQSQGPFLVTFCDTAIERHRAQRFNHINDSRAGGLDLIVLVDT